MKEGATTVHVQALRFDPQRQEGSWVQCYSVKTTEPLSVMAILAKLREMDESFACRTSSCFKGQCGSCLIRVNGRDVMGCLTLINPGETVVIEPCSKYQVIRDMVVDFSQTREERR